MRGCSYHVHENHRYFYHRSPTTLPIISIFVFQWHEDNQYRDRWLRYALPNRCPDPKADPKKK